MLLATFHNLNSKNDYQFSLINISQGNVAMNLKGGAISDDYFTLKFKLLLSRWVKAFFKNQSTLGELQ